MLHVLCLKAFQTRTHTHTLSECNSKVFTDRMNARDTVNVCCRISCRIHIFHLLNYCDPIDIILIGLNRFLCYLISTAIAVDRISISGQFRSGSG